MKAQGIDREMKVLAIDMEETPEARMNDRKRVVCQEKKSSSSVVCQDLKGIIRELSEQFVSLFSWSTSEDFFHVMSLLFYLYITIS